MNYDQKTLLERVRRRAFTTNDRRQHEIPLFREEWDALLAAGEISPADREYRNLKIKKLWEA